jgi:hypothetical protein
MVMRSASGRSAPGAAASGVASRARSHRASTPVDRRRLAGDAVGDEAHDAAAVRPVGRVDAVGGRGGRGGDEGLERAPRLAVPRLPRDGERRRAGGREVERTSTGAAPGEREQRVVREVEDVGDGPRRLEEGERRPRRGGGRVVGPRVAAGPHGADVGEAGRGERDRLLGLERQRLGAPRHLAPTRVPAGTRESPTLGSAAKATGARAACAGRSPTPSRS